MRGSSLSRVGLFALGAMLVLSLSPVASVAPVRASVEATELCVTFAEAANGAGDQIAFCDVIHTNVFDSNLTNNTAGIHNGCDGFGGSHQSSWNDCPSSFTLAGLRVGERLELFYNTFYGLRVVCYPYNTNSFINLINVADNSISSLRITTGSC